MKKIFREVRKGNIYIASVYCSGVLFKGIKQIIIRR